LTNCCRVVREQAAGSRPSASASPGRAAARPGDRSGARGGGSAAGWARRPRPLHHVADQLFDGLALGPRASAIMPTLRRMSPSAVSRYSMILARSSACVILAPPPGNRRHREKYDTGVACAALRRDDGGYLADPGGCDTDVACPMERRQEESGPMPVHVVRLGSPRGKGEGLRIGTVRRPPRGCRNPNSPPAISTTSGCRSSRQRGAGEARADGGRRESVEDVRQALPGRDGASGGEPPAGSPRRAVAGDELRVGCYCADEARCHRSVLRKLLAERGARMP